MKKWEQTLTQWKYEFEHYVDIIVHGSSAGMKEWGFDVIDNDGSCPYFTPYLLIISFSNQAQRKGGTTPKTQ